MTANSARRRVTVRLGEQESACPESSTPVSYFFTLGIINESAGIGWGESETFLRLSAYIYQKSQ